MVGQTGDEDSRLEPELLQVAEVLVAGNKQCNYRHKASIWNSSSRSTAGGRQGKTLARVLLIATWYYYCPVRLVTG